MTPECKAELTAIAREKYKAPVLIVNKLLKDFEPIINKHMDIAQNTTPKFITYKNRNPDPGVCVVISINWETRRMEVSNGSVRLFPNFGEINYV